MIRSVSRFRALLVAVAAIVLTAGAALASYSPVSMPSAAAGGLERAAEAAGKTVPVAAPVRDAREGANEDTDEDADEDGTDADAPAEDQASVDAAEHPDNHGKLVSAAAQDPTPDGFHNHGQYVRTIAADNHGQAVAAGHAPDKGATSKPTR